MFYELKIGWRYLLECSPLRTFRDHFIFSILLGLIGLALCITTGFSSTIGCVSVVISSVFLVVLILLTLFSIFTMVSMMGVVLGVAALTIALAMTSGFQHQFKDKILGVNAHVYIRQNGGFLADYPKVIKQVSAHPDVMAVHPFHFLQMQVTNGKGVSAGVAIKGVQPETMSGVLDLHKYMEKGDVESLERSGKDDELPAIVLGRVLAKKLKVDNDDIVTVVAPFSDLDFKNWNQKKEAHQPVQQKFRVSGVFYSGFDEYDRKLMYINLLEAQKLAGKGDKVLGVELTVRNIHEAKSVARALGDTLGPEFIVEDWHKLNEPLFKALSMQKILIAIILTIIIMVASFNMVSALTMMVVDKTREIAILRSMGATESGMSRIFLLVGLVIGIAGTTLGVGLGVVFCQVFDRYDYNLDPKVYFIDRLPFIINWHEVLMIVGITIAISMMATIFPCRKAARLVPLEGLRHE